MVKIPRLGDLPQELLSEKADAEAHLKRVNEKLERAILDAVGVAAGDLLENPYTGLLYQVHTAHAHLGTFGPGVVLRGYRLFKSGRRANRTSRSEVFISDACEKVNKDVE